MAETTRAAVRAALEQSQAAMTVPQIRKALPAAVLIPPKEIDRLLNQMAAEREIFLWPGKRFWDRNPDAEAGRLIMEILAGPLPMTAAKIKAALKLPMEVVHSALDRLVGDGRVHIWQPGKTVMYTSLDPAEAARKSILTAIAEEPLDEKAIVAAVRKRLPGFGAKHLREHLFPLAQSGKIKEHPRFGKTKARYATKPPEPGPYLAGAVKEVKAVHTLLATFQISLERILEALGRELGLEGRAPRAEGKGSEDRRGSDEAERQVLEGIVRLQPLGQNRALVSIRELRRSLGLAKSRFDRAVFSLALQGKVALHQHDFPSTLSPEEREELVKDEQGTYYIGIVPVEVS